MFMKSILIFVEQCAEPAPVLPVLRVPAGAVTVEVQQGVRSAMTTPSPNLPIPPRGVRGDMRGSAHAIEVPDYKLQE